MDDNTLVLRRILVCWIAGLAGSSQSIGWSKVEDISLLKDVENENGPQKVTCQKQAQTALSKSIELWIKWYITSLRLGTIKKLVDKPYIFSAPPAQCSVFKSLLTRKKTANKPEIGKRNQISDLCSRRRNLRYIRNEVHSSWSLLVGFHKHQLVHVSRR